MKKILILCIASLIALTGCGSNTSNNTNSNEIIENEINNYDVNNSSNKNDSVDNNETDEFNKWLKERNKNDSIKVNDDSWVYDNTIRQSVNQSKVWGETGSINGFVVEYQNTWKTNRVSNAVHFLNVGYQTGDTSNRMSLALCVDNNTFILKEDPIVTSLEEVPDFYAQTFMRASENSDVYGWLYKGSSEYEIIETEKITFAGQDCISFTAKATNYNVVDDIEKTWDCYIVGYSFFIKNIPVAIIGGLWTETQSPEEILKLNEYVKEVASTIRYIDMGY